MVKQKRTVPNCLKHAIFGDGAFAVGVVYDLEGAVQGIAAQRQVDDTMLLPRLTLHNSEILFLDSPFLKLFLQMMVGIRRFRHQ